MKLRLYRDRLALVLLVCAFAGCATVGNDEQTVRETEAMLDDAGFTRIAIDIPSDQLSNLPAYRLNRYDGERGAVFWYYDPDYCQCLYEGDKEAADRYQYAMSHRGDLAQYQADYETEESAAQQAVIINRFAGAVPTPFMWGGWGSWYGYAMGYRHGWWGGGYRSGPIGPIRIPGPKPGKGGHHGRLGGGGHGGGGGHPGAGGHHGGGRGGGHR